MAETLPALTPDTPAAEAETHDTPETSERIDATTALESLSGPERQSWQEKGTLPERIEVTRAGDQPAEGAKPEPPKLSKRQQEINDHIRKATEATLRAEAAEKKAAELEARLAKGTPPPSPRTDTRTNTGGNLADPAAQPPAKTPPAEDREPVLDDFLDQQDPYQSLLDARVDYKLAQAFKAREAEAQTRTKAEREEAEVQRVFTEYQQRETALKASHPDFDAKTEKVRHAIHIGSPLGRALIESPVAPELILHFADHPDDFARIGALGVSSLPAALRELGKLEARLEAGAPPPAADAMPPLTSAPRPPTTLGSRAAEGSDEVESAIRRKDVGAYLRAQNARDLAAARK